MLRHLADALGLPLFTWTRSRGIVRDDVGDPAYDTKDSLKAFHHVAVARVDGLYHFMGVGSDVLQGSLSISHLRDAVRSMEDREGALVLTGDLEPPPVWSRSPRSRMDGAWITGPSNPRSPARAHSQ